jgi:RNA polymerase sigma-70 factor (ECF subfamily)
MTASLLGPLLRSARRGDEEAFRKLVEATRERLFWTVKRMIGRDALAEEILQDAYVALWGLSEGSQPKEVGAWLHRFCVNRSIDHLRREETRRMADGPEALEYAAAAHGPDESLGLREMEEALAGALSGLPPQERAAFVLKLVEGLDYSEVAELMGVAESTVRNQVMQARRKIEKKLALAGVMI